MKIEENKLNFAVIPQDFLSEMKQELTELKRILSEKSEEEISGQWVESVKVPGILGISKKTWQTYRDKRLIPFSQIGSKIYVKRADIEEFMNSHYIKAKQ